MPDTGAKACGTGAQGNLVGGKVAWSNPTRIQVEDGSSATALIGTTAGGKSNSLEATNFTFGIPAGSSVIGVLAEWKIAQGAHAGTGVFDTAMLLIKSSSILPGCSNKASFTGFPVGLTFRSYGGSSDTWGATLTDTDVNDSTFGCYMTCENDDPDNTGSVDFVRMTIYYTSSSTALPRVQAVVAYRPMHPMEIME